MAIPSEWAGLPVSPTLPYLRVSKVCLMRPGDRERAMRATIRWCNAVPRFVIVYIRGHVTITVLLVHDCVWQTKAILFAGL